MTTPAPYIYLPDSGHFPCLGKFLRTEGDVNIYSLSPTQEILIKQGDPTHSIIKVYYISENEMQKIIQSNLNHFSSFSITADGVFLHSNLNHFNSISVTNDNYRKFY